MSCNNCWDAVYYDLNTTEFVFENGTTTIGPSLPEAMSAHCMVLLHTGDIMFMFETKVWRFNHLTKEFIRMKDMPHIMKFSGCSLFHSPAHENRPLVFIGGGLWSNKSMVLDYTISTTWEERKFFKSI